jgi:hypothetical protein
VLGYNAGVSANDVPFRSTFPYMAPPHRGYDYTKKLTTSTVRRDDGGSPLGMTAPAGFFLGAGYPNPTQGETTLNFHLNAQAPVTVALYSIDGKRVATLVNQVMTPGDHRAVWTPDAGVPAGSYIATLAIDGSTVANTKVALAR